MDRVDVPDACPGSGRPPAKVVAPRGVLVEAQCSTCTQRFRLRTDGNIPRHLKADR